MGACFSTRVVRIPLPSSSASESGISIRCPSPPSRSRATSAAQADSAVIPAAKQDASGSDGKSGIPPVGPPKTGELAGRE